MTDLARYGLDRPSLTVEVTAGPAPNQVETILLGAAVPDAPGTFYAKRGDQNDVVKVEGKALLDIGTDPLALRSRKVTAFDLAKSDFLEIEAGGLTHRLSRGPDGWRVLAPEPGSADPRALRDLFKTLDELRALDVYSASRVSASGLADPVMVLRAWRGTGTAEGRTERPDVPPAFTFRLGRFDPVRNVRYARNEGDTAILALPNTVADLIPDGPLAYRDHTIMGLTLGSIGRIHVEHEGKAVTVAAGPNPRDYEHWTMTEPVRASVDAQNVARIDLLLSRLRAENLVAQETDDRARYGLESPWLTATWTTLSPDGTLSDKPGTLRVGAEVPDSAGSRYAKVDGQPTVFTLAPQAQAILNGELHARGIFRFPINQVTRIVLRYPDRSLSFAREARAFEVASDWIPEEGTDAEASSSARLNSLIQALANLTTPKFEQYVGSFPSESGLNEPALVIEVHLSGGQGTRMVRIGSPTETPNVRLATADTGDSGAIFHLPPGPWMSWLPPAETSTDGALPEDVFAP